MFNQFMKVSTHNGEQRWINLDRVHRVSYANDQNGDPILVFSFDNEDRVSIHGTDEENRALIGRIVSSLDEVMWESAARLIS
ncbi:MAG: hypothetical protein KDA22_16020 [Phycisphaerales bacterium]|nr:hypothetical protein [Phycisphaerales bacterium]